MSERTHKKTMVRETFLYLPAKLLEGFIGIFTISCYAALFSPTAYGEYLLLNTIVIFASLVLTGWLTNSTIRFIGENTDETNLKSFFSTVFTLWGALTLVVYVVCVIAYFLLGRQLFFFCPALLFTSYSLFQILSAALVQLRKIKLNISLSLLSAVLKLILAYTIFFVLPDAASQPYPAIAATFLSDLIAGLLALAGLHIHKRFSIRSVRASLSRQFFDYGFPLLGVSVSIGLLNIVDRFIVNGLVDSAALAVYNANYSISSAIFTLIIAAVMRGVYPSILDGFRCGGAKEALPLLSYGARMYLLIALPAAFGLCAVSPVLSRVMFVRPEYAEGIPVIGLIGGAMFFMGLIDYVNKAWELNRNTVPVLQNSMAAVLVKIIASICLIRLIGISGAALGTLLAFVFYFILSVLRARKLFLFSLPTLTWFRLVTSALICGAGAFLVSLFSPLGNLVTLIVAVLTGCLLYAACLVISGEIRSELEQVKARLCKKS